MVVSGDPPKPDTGEGNPPSLLKLADGRLCLTYGVRARPYRMQARFSGDQGKTWSEPFVLRDDGAAADVGYPRFDHPARWQAGCRVLLQRSLPTRALYRRHDLGSGQAMNVSRSCQGSWGSDPLTSINFAASRYDAETYDRPLRGRTLAVNQKTEKCSKNCDFFLTSCLMTR